MVLVAPVFLTFGSISIAIWLALRFSLNIPMDIDEDVFKALMTRISTPISLAVILYFAVGIAGLLIPSPSGITTYDVYFLVFFGYILPFLILGLRRVDAVWPGRKLSTFGELLHSMKMRDYKRIMAVKIYEAYKETNNLKDRKQIASYLASLLLA